MVSIPQRIFKDKEITYKQFSDVLIIGMMGLTDYLMDKDALPYNIDGMINYHRVAVNLGLKFEDDWIEALEGDVAGFGPACSIRLQSPHLRGKSTKYR